MVTHPGPEAKQCFFIFASYEETSKSGGTISQAASHLEASSQSQGNTM
jgi:hypothetical protein